MSELRLINTQSDFESVIQAEKAIVFITFEWSGPAQLSEKIVAAYQANWQVLHKGLLHVAFFKIEPDNHSFMHRWVRDEVGERGGYGSLVWVKNGAIADYEINVAFAGITSIAHRTEIIFRN